MNFHRSEKTLSVLLTIIGAGLIVLAVFADMLFGGSRSFGPQQLSLVAFGAVVLLLGLVLRFPKESQGTVQASVRRVSLLVLAAWFGLLTGFLETMVLRVNQLVRPRFLKVSPDSIWMGPLVNLLVFVAAGAVLLTISRRWPRFGTTRAISGVCTFLGCWTLLMVFSEIHQLASVALSAGLAARAAALMARNEAIHRLVRPTIVWMVMLVMIAGPALALWDTIDERMAIAKLPPAQPGAPNVLLIVLDTVRAQSLSLYGYRRPTTPNLEKLAQRGVVFENAIATSPWTLPTHASLMTGRYHHEVSANWSKPLDGTHPTLAEALSSHGYISAGFVANYYYAGDSAGIARGFTHFEDYRITPGQAVLSSSLGRTLSGSHALRRTLNWYDDLNRKTAEQVNQEFLRWLSRKGERPFLAFLNFYDAHRPYVPPVPFHKKFGANEAHDREYSPSPSDIDARRFSQQQIQVELDDYEGAIAYLDDQLGRLFDELDRRRVLENTLVLITSDHGEQFGEHNRVGHGNSLYMPVLRVPLLLSFPGRIPSNVRISEHSTLRDVPATIVDSLGLADENRIPGSSLARYWQTEQAPAPESPLLSELTLIGGESRGWFRSLIVAGHHYIRSQEGTEQLYDLQNDPEELKNLAKTETSGPLLDRFRDLLNKAVEPPREADNLGHQERSASNAASLGLN